MEATEVIGATIDRNARMIQKALEGLSDPDLRLQPNDHCNPVGWLIWHQTRFADLVTTHVTAVPQVWMEGRWYERFGMEPNPQDTRVGQTLEQVMALNPTKEALVGYLDAVREKVMGCLGKLTPSDLDKEIPDVFQGTCRAGDLLGRMLSDFIQHCGQVFYLRGYIAGHGWYPR